MTKSFLSGAALGAVLLTAPAFAQAAPAVLLGRPAPAQTVSFSVHLPLRNEAQLQQLISLQSDPASPLYGHFLTVAEFRANYGPAAATIAQATAALRAHGLAVTGQTTQALSVRGATASIESTFQTKLGMIRDTSGSVRVAQTAGLTIPAELAAIGATVTGLEPVTRMHVHSKAVPLNRNAPYGGYWFDDLKQAYAYPDDRTFDGAGATIGILMSSDVLDSDIAGYFAQEKYTAISHKKIKPLIHEAIGGGGGIGSGGFAEANIDVQTSQGSAPGAQVKLYNIPDLSDGSIFNGYVNIVEENVADVISSSFGECELFYLAAYNHGVDQRGILAAYTQLFEQGNSQGQTFLASSGDNAGLDCAEPAYLSGANGKFIAGVDFPAVDPYVTGVGGTNLKTTTPPSPQPKPPVLTSQYVGESDFGDLLTPYDPYGTGGNLSGGVWGSGSGNSTIFAKPAYQNLLKTGSSTRAVPDVSMMMGGCPGGISVKSPCPGTSYGIYEIEGGFYGFIGTSLSSPEFAGLLAVKVGLNKSLGSPTGRLGNVNTYIYKLAAQQYGDPGKYAYYHTGIPGYNGVVTVPTGVHTYNPIVGVGTPRAHDFLGLPGIPLAGNPQTISNP